MLATLIEKSLFPYENEASSWYVRRVDGTQHAPRTPEAEERSFTAIRDLLLEGARRCPLTVFVFDELNAMSPSLVTALRPYLGGRATVDGVSFARCTFVFISNSASLALGQWWYDMDANEDMLMSVPMRDVAAEVRRGLNDSATDRERFAPIVEHNLAQFVPFFPLTRRAVRRCVVYQLERERDAVVAEEREVAALSWGSEAVEHLLEARVWQDHPAFGGRFSREGCRNVATAVGTAVERALGGIGNRRVPLGRLSPARARALADGRPGDAWRGYEYSMRDALVRLRVRDGRLKAEAHGRKARSEGGEEKEDL